MISENMLNNTSGSRNVQRKGGHPGAPRYQYPRQELHLMPLRDLSLRVSFMVDQSTLSITLDQPSGYTYVYIADFAVDI